MTILTAIQSTSTYPIPTTLIERVAVEMGMDVTQELTQEVAKSSAYKRLTASAYDFLASAPNISQGGVSFSFSTDERNAYKRKAQELRNEANGTGVGEYGWQGEDF